MSNKLRNPFKMRASEKVESDASFLRLFSPIALEALGDKHKEGKLWENILFIHSSPGAGKTSLIRVFDPSSLLTLLMHKSDNLYKELYTSLKRIDAIDEDRIAVLGVTLTCTRNYEILEELGLSAIQKKRLFFSLLNARMIIAALRSACAIGLKKFPEGLGEIEFVYDNSDNFFKKLETPCTGLQLYQWASDIERQIYKAIDSFLPIDDNQIEGHDELFAPLVLNANNLLIGGKQICRRVLFMLDDAHKLSKIQRSAISTYVIEKRGNFSIWISERLEALEPLENLGSYIDRDYEELNLEKIWSDSSKKFEKILESIAEKRAAISTEDVNSFKEYLNGSLNEERYKSNLTNFINSRWEAINRFTSLTHKYDEWFNYAANFEGGTLEKAILIKCMEIIIQRNQGKEQLSFEFALSKEELNEKMSSDIIGAAKLFVSAEAKIPYYFGFPALSKLSSNNIEQFLSFAGELFEEMISNKISGTDLMLSDETQQKIIKEIVDQKWKDLSRTIPYSDQVIKFLSGIGEFARKDTFKLNAPYAPGVNGFAIKAGNELKLINEGSWLQNPIYESLVNVISTCVAFNLLEVKAINQGKKNQTWDVYYLNRWLCVKFGLPMSYGGWRHKSPDELVRWIKK